MIVVEDPMTTADGRLVRGGWTDGTYVYGWILATDEGEHPHWVPYVWDQEGRERPATEHHNRIEKLLTEE